MHVYAYVYTCMEERRLDPLFVHSGISSTQNIGILLSVYFAGFFSALSNCVYSHWLTRICYVSTVFVFNRCAQVSLCLTLFSSRLGVSDIFGFWYKTASVSGLHDLLLASAHFAKPERSTCGFPYTLGAYYPLLCRTKRVRMLCSDIFWAEYLGLLPPSMCCM